MTFENIIRQEEFGPQVAQVLLVAVAESYLRFVPKSEVVETLLQQTEQVLQRFPQMDPLQKEACRAMAQSLADHLNSVSGES